MGEGEGQLEHEGVDHKGSKNIEVYLRLRPVATPAVAIAVDAAENRVDFAVLRSAGSGCVAASSFIVANCSLALEPCTPRTGMSITNVSCTSSSSAASSWLTPSRTRCGC